MPASPYSLWDLFVCFVRLRASCFTPEYRLTTNKARGMGLKRPSSMLLCMWYKACGASLPSNGGQHRRLAPLDWPLTRSWLLLINWHILTGSWFPGSQVGMQIMFWRVYRDTGASRQTSSVAERTARKKQLSDWSTPTWSSFCRGYDGWRHSLHRSSNNPTRPKQ